MNIERKKVYKITDWAIDEKIKTYDSQNHNNLFIKMFALPTPDTQSRLTITE